MASFETIAMQSELVSKKTLIRVKRKKSEQRVNSNKKCKFVGSCDTNDDNNAYQLLDNGLLNGKQPQQLFQINDFDVDMICEENALKSLDLNETKTQNTICCNDQPLEVVDNNVDDYIYDIYLYDNFDWDDNYRECEDEDPSSNDENYAYNDYPEDSDADVVHHYDDDDHYYDAFDDEEEQRLRNSFAVNQLVSNESSDSRSESDSDDYLAAKQNSDDSSDGDY